MSEELNQVPGVEVPAGAVMPGTNLKQGSAPTVSPEVAAEVAAANELNDNTIGDVPTVADPEHSAPAVEQPVEEQPAAPVDPMIPVGPN